MATTTHTHIWLRDEVKPKEKRTALTPKNCEALIQAGFQLSVEKTNSNRIFPDSDYEKVGCKLVENGSWKSAPKDAFILGLKELPEPDDSPLQHQHIYFGHCYKQQQGWEDLLRRFLKGGEKLLDLEFLVDDIGRRVAAFGRPAGVGGAAVGVAVWSHQQLHGPNSKTPKPIASFEAYENEEQMVKQLKAQLDAAVAVAGRKPSAIIIGSKGRCGNGVIHILDQLGLKATEWDMEETAKGGPFPEVLDYDIFFNTIYLSSAIPPFLTNELVDRPNRKLSVVVDISCDTSNPHNPIPIYNQGTTFVNPTLVVRKEPLLEVVAIDHLPSLVPLESSVNYSDQLLPSLLELKSFGPVWQRADKLFKEKAALV